HRLAPYLDTRTHRRRVREPGDGGRRWRNVRRAPRPVRAGQSRLRAPASSVHEGAPPLRAESIQSRRTIAFPLRVGAEPLAASLGLSVPPEVPPREARVFGRSGTRPRGPEGNRGGPRSRMLLQRGS